MKQFLVLEGEGAEAMEVEKSANDASGDSSDEEEVNINETLSQLREDEQKDIKRWLD